MSDEMLHELERELAKEKERIFFQKYKNIIFLIGGVILLAVGGYQYSNFQQEKKFQHASDDYYRFKEHYTNIESLTDINAPIPQILPETIKNVPAYYSISQLVRFNNARKHDASDKKLLKITTDYVQSSQEKSLTIHDSVLKLFHLSLLVDKTDFATIESQFIEYIKHPLAFKSLVYEMLFLLSVNDNNANKARLYLKNLQDNTAPQSMDKITIYQTHPLLNPVADKPSQKKA